MKTILTLLAAALALTPSAFADYDFQASKILGAWDCGSGRKVLLIQKQSETTIKTYACDRSDYLEYGRCNYERIYIDKYDSNFDGYCQTGRPYCYDGLQVSLQYPDEMMDISDPLGLNDASDAGRTNECRRI